MAIQLTHYHDSRVLEEAKALLQPGASTYSVALEMGMPQSTVWWHLTHRLPELDPGLADQVQVVLKENLHRKGQ